MTSEQTILDLQKMLERERISKEIYAELNQFVDFKNTLTAVLSKFKEISKCEAVSIRLHNAGDYPYYVYDGFDDSFICQENELCARDEYGEKQTEYDAVKGEEVLVLDCMCGNVIRGRIDPSLTFFTEGGSFWSNNTSELLSTTTSEELQAETRNECNSAGYKSVALIPIRTKNEIVGLIQLNDKRNDMFSEDFIEFMEVIAQQLGIAIQNSIAYTKLLSTQQAIEGVLDLVNSQVQAKIDLAEKHPMHKPCK